VLEEKCVAHVLQRQLPDGGWNIYENCRVSGAIVARTMTAGGRPLMPRTGKHRLHFDLAPPVDGDQQAEADRLVSLGATRVDIGQGEVSWVVMADPDGHEFCLLTS